MDFSAHAEPVDHMAILKALHTTDKRYSTEGNRLGSTRADTAPVDLRTVDKHFEEIKKFQLEIEKQKEFLSTATNFRKTILQLVESPQFSAFIMTVILLNITLLMLSTWRSIERVANYYFTIIDGIFLGIYITEAILKIYVWRIDYFRQGWDILDLVIVFTSVTEIIAPLAVGTSFTGGGTTIFRILRVLRALRSLRVLRTIKFLENIQVILVTCLYSFKSIGAIMMLMTLFLVIFAVIGRGLFETIDKPHFGNFGVATFTLIQLLTLDDWFEIFTDVTDQLGYFDMKMFSYLLFYIIIEYFVFLNLFIAVLVDNFQLTLQEKILRKAEDREQENIEKELGALYNIKSDGNEDNGSLGESQSEDDLEKIKREIFERSDKESKETSSSAATSEESYSAERDLTMSFPDADKYEISMLEMYYQILPALEKETYIHSNSAMCLERILDRMVDNTTEYK